MHRKNVYPTFQEIFVHIADKYVLIPKIEELINLYKFIREAL